MRSLRLVAGARRLFALLGVCSVLLAALVSPGAAERPTLQLEVLINGSPRNLIGTFLLLDDGLLAATPAELKEIGLVIPEGGREAKIVVLDQLPGITYRYDERRQRILITAAHAQLVPTHLDLRPTLTDIESARSDFGAVLNYNLFARTGDWHNWEPFGLVGSSLTLDARLFSPFGVFAQSGIVRSPIDREIDVLRLNSTYSYSDETTMVTYRAGDAISGGLAWTRPIRFGGVQIFRNFGLRPDLILMPLPSINGTAAVPSTVDVYINNTKAFSGDIGAGPFSFSNLPTVSGSGMARLVLRDSSGQERTTTLPFYASPNLLAPGLSSFSIEGGFPRRFYGTLSDEYSEKPVLSATLRKGIYDWLTVEAHTEMGGGLINAGGGALMRTGHLGVASVAAAASHYDGAWGLQLYFGYDISVHGLTISASSKTTWGAYEDLASTSARVTSANPPAPGPDAGSRFNFFPSVWSNFQVPKALHRITIGAPLAIDQKSHISLSYIDLDDGNGSHTNLLTASWSRALGESASLFATVFTDWGDRRRSGAFMGVSIPLGGKAAASTSVATADGATALVTDAGQPLGLTPGSLGWRVRDLEGPTTYREASVAYRASAARVQVGVSQDSSHTHAFAEVEGAIATVGGTTFLANRIDDAFAVVDTAVPGVEVFHENQLVGRTDQRGKILVPGLRSYQKNKITIDTRSLPVDSEIETTANTVAPAEQSGVLVRFGIKTNIQAAILVFFSPDGKPLPPGSRGKIDGGEEFVVGYDGQAYAKNLGAHNSATVVSDKRTCRTNFSFVASPHQQVVISPIICHPVS